MLDLRIKEKKTVKFVDNTVFNFSSTSEKEFSYLRNEFEIHTYIQTSLPSDEVILKNFVNPDTSYKITIKYIDNGSTFDSCASISEIDDSNDTSFEAFSDNPNESNESSIFYKHINGTDIKFKLNKNSGMINAYLVQIIFEELNYTVISLKNPLKGISLNKSQKEVSDYANYKVSYSNKFEIVLDNNTNKYLKFKNLNGNSYSDYLAVLSDKGLDIMFGSLRFNLINSNDVKDTVNCVFIEDISSFFKDIKIKKLKDLSTAAEFSHKDFNVNFALMYNNMDNPTIQKENDTTVYYGIVDNGQIQYWNINTNDYKGMIQKNNNGVNYYGRACQLSVNDIYPSVYVRKLWDQIHKQAGINYEGDFFNTDNFNALLLNYWGDYKLPEEDKKSRYSAAEFSHTHYTSIHNQSIIEELIIETIPETEVGDIYENYYTPSKDSIMKVKLKGSLRASLCLSDSDSEDLIERSGTDTYTFTSRYFIYLRGHKSGEYNNYTGTGGINEGFNYFIRIMPYLINLNYDVNGGYEEHIEEFEIELDYNLFSSLDKYELIIKQDFYEFPPLLVEKLDLNAKGNFLKTDVTGIIEYISHDKIPPNNVFNVNKLMPDITQGEFIKNIATLFNLRFTFDGNTNTIHWHTFDEFYMKESEVKDLTAKIDKDSIQKQLGAEFQTSEYNFAFKDVKGTSIEKYNSEHEHKFGSYKITQPGEVKKEKTNITLKFGIQDYEWKGNYQLPITSNCKKTGYPTSSAYPRNMNTIPYLSYQNIRTLFLDQTMVFRNALGKRYLLTTFPTSSPLLGITYEGALTDVFSLEFYPKDVEFNYYKQPNLGLYKSYFMNDYNDIIDKNAIIYKVKAKLTNHDFLNLKLNDIIQFNGITTRIIKISNFNEHSLTTLELLKIKFNPNYTGTVINPTAYILPSSYNLELSSVLTNAATYTTPSESFTITYDHLIDDLVIRNDGDSKPFQLSLDDSTWHDMNHGDSVTIRTAGSLVNGETITLYYRILNGDTTLEEAITSNWHLVSGDVFETLGLKCRLKQITPTMNGVAVIEPYNREINVNGGSQTVVSQAFIEPLP